MRIDRDSFLGGWIEALGYDMMAYTEDIHTALCILLLWRYWEKFDERYHTSLACSSLSNLILSRTEKEWVFQEECLDLYVEYEYFCSDLFSNAAFIAGFDVFSIMISEDIFPVEIWMEEKKARKRALSELLHTRGFPDSWLPLFWKNLSKIERSYGSMEDGEIIIMQNRSIGAYKKFRREHEEMVHNYFAEEEQAIEDVLDDLMYPLTYTNVHDNGYLGDNYYIYFDTGCDGYNHLSFSMLSMQWVISCVVLGKLLRDFRDKVYQLMDIHLEFGLTS